MKNLVLPVVRDTYNKSGVPKYYNNLKLDAYFNNKHDALKLQKIWPNAIIVEATEEALTKTNIWVTRRVFAVYR